MTMLAHTDSRPIEVRLAEAKARLAEAKVRADRLATLRDEAIVRRDEAIARRDEIGERLEQQVAKQRVLLVRLGLGTLASISVDLADHDALDRAEFQLLVDHAVEANQEPRDFREAIFGFGYRIDPTF